MHWWTFFYAKEGKAKLTALSWTCPIGQTRSTVPLTMTLTSVFVGPNSGGPFQWSSGRKGVWRLCRTLWTALADIWLPSFNETDTLLESMTDRQKRRKNVDVRENEEEIQMLDDILSVCLRGNTWINCRSNDSLMSVSRLRPKYSLDSSVQSI